MQIHQILVRPEDQKMIILYLDLAGRRNSIVVDTTGNSVVEQLVTQCEAKIPPDVDNPAKPQIQQEITDLEARITKLKQSIGVS
jgi:hypothetical protein